ncbi:MAG: signal peptidase I [Patescibacteria group bacterium]|nr:signal peptidase I [Patescibacteria group bacterium]
MEVEHKFENKSQFLKEVIQFVLIVLIVVLPIRFFIAQPFVVSGESMDSTFNNGNYLIVDELSYRFSNPKRGDVVIFKYPYDQKRYLIKRLIGLPLETVKMKSGIITIENQDGEFVLSEPYIDSKNNLLYGDLEVILQDDEYFVLGDNRIASSDSRIWGNLSKNLIIGRPIIRLFPFNSIEVLPGSYNKYVQ